jgi:predicted phage terminase large subunit-like protein
VLGFDRANVFILDRIRLKAKFDGQLRAVLQLCEQHPDALTKLVEDKATGSPMLDLLRPEIPGLIAVVPRGPKEARARVVLPRVAAGQVYLPDGAPWLVEWVEEFAAFPDGRHDDQIDTLSQAVINAGPQKSSALEAARAMARW